MRVQPCLPHRPVHFFIHITSVLQNSLYDMPHPTPLVQGALDLHLANVLVSWGCPNKLPQTWWFKTADIYSFTPLEARSPKSRSQVGCVPSEVSMETLFVNSSIFWWLRHFWAYSSITHSLFLSSHGLLFCVSTLPLPFYYKDTCH